MRNEIAEWMLAQAAPPAQAKMIVGDLLEAQHGPVEFWVAVLRATASIAQHQPAQMLVSLFWFFYELSLYAFIAWMVTKTHKHGAIVIIVAALWIAVGWLVRRKLGGELSGLATPVFWTWLIHRAGLPIWLGVIFLPTMLFGWWLRWGRRPKPGGNRPIAG